MFIVACGNLTDGFVFYGPYLTFEIADKASKTMRGTTWVYDLNDPQDASTEEYNEDVGYPRRRGTKNG